MIQLGAVLLGGHELILLLIIAFFGLGVLFICGLRFLLVHFLSKPSTPSSPTAAPLPPPGYPSGAPSPFPPPAAPAPRDNQHLDLLAIFHYVLAAFAFLGIAFLGLHATIMHAVFTSPDIFKHNGNNNPPPEFVMHILIWVYVFAGTVLILSALLNLLSGICLHRRTHRTFSLIIAGLNCLHFPFGTVLGIFTIIILSRESVRILYEESPAPQA